MAWAPGHAVLGSGSLLSKSSRRVASACGEEGSCHTACSCGAGHLRAICTALYSSCQQVLSTELYGPINGEDVDVLGLVVLWLLAQRGRAVVNGAVTAAMWWW
eukprot:1358189-Amphidinium_carterae.1